MKKNAQNSKPIDRVLPQKQHDISRMRRGFTVIELIVATMITALVVGTITLSTSQLSRGRSITKLRLEATTRAQGALDAVRRDIVSTVRDEDLFRARVVIYDGEAFSPYGVVDRDELVIFNNRMRPIQGDRYSGEGGEYETQYRVEDDYAGSALWQRRDAVPDENPEGGGTVTPLVDGIIGFKVEAYDGESWYPDWDSDFDGIPWALRITVVATGDPAGSEPSDATKSTIVLRTQIALDRIVPPLEETDAEQSKEESAAEGDAAAADAAGGGTPTDPATGLPAPGGDAGGGAGGGITGPQTPGGGPGGGDFGQPGGGGPGMGTGGGGATRQPGRPPFNGGSGRGRGSTVGRPSSPSSSTRGNRGG